MLDQLPLELVIYVAEHAAYTLRFTHRKSVVNLAATSKTIYKIVVPILNQIMIVTNSTVDRIISFVFDPDTSALAARACAHVRTLIHDIGITFRLDPTLFTSLECVHALGFVIGDAVQAIIRVPCSLRRIHVLSVDFAQDVTLLPVEALQTITHASGFLPFFSTRSSDWKCFSGTPKVWMRQLVHNLPALTHLGLVLVGIRKSEGQNSSALKSDLDSLRAAVGIALQFSRLQQIALRIGGRYLDEQSQDIEHMVQQILDPRFMVWRDERPLFSWHDWNKLMHDDVNAGRDIWTEARPV